MGNAYNPYARAPWGQSLCIALEKVSTLLNGVPYAQVATNAKNFEPTS
jgi:hypothetical protein